ncbi:DUF72 domain-containing protein [Hansschlegelia quercus]|uniref:DUF72 domain-containing protein n=1 Tax=Hansschlegelia quercus TaxID=2528245 RepID=UPI001FDF8BAE|nr:DUF72 domain-containing protein [Hansschlegelia quercus]
MASRYAEAVPGPGTHLERYARRLNAVEINSSFYRAHQHKTYERWAQSTPEGFRFSVKVSKAITHERALVDCASLIDAFASEVAGLGEKLGVLLVQLPRSSKADRATAGDFFDQLRAVGDATIAFEPRHDDWFTPEADEWLAERQIARVAADPAPAPGADEPGGWGGLRYYRWHGSPRLYYSDYDEAALVSLRKRVEEDLATAPAWCVFDNTASGAALGNALTFTGL